MDKYQNEYYPPEFEFRTLGPMVHRKPLYGVGINDAPYVTRPTVNGRQIRCPFHAKWSGMLQRCHSVAHHKQHPTYMGTTHCTEWASFMCFRVWLLKELRKTSLTIREAQLDKDILSTEKYYSPQTCLLIPASLNNFLVDSQATRGELPIGVSKNGEGFSAHIGDGNKRRNYLGTFPTPKEAYQVWRSGKIKMAETIQLPKHLDTVIVREALIQRIKEMK